MLVDRQISLSQTQGVTSVRIALPITREAIADYLGLTIETVSRQISALKKTNVIQLEGLRSVVAPDLAALREEAGEGPVDIFCLIDVMFANNILYHSPLSVVIPVVWMSAARLMADRQRYISAIAPEQPKHFAACQRK